MYLPAFFQESRPEALHAVMRARPLATLVTTSDAGLTANHIPVETLSDPAPFGMLRGHIARANPLWRQYREGSEAMAIFQGPQAYVSPSYYPSKKESGQVVPTWDYAVVHAHGTLRFFQEAQWLRGMVTRLTDAHEASRALPWKVTDAPAPYVDKQLSLIVGFELSIIRLTGKFKMSQNHATPNRRGVSQGLRARGDAEAGGVADILDELESARDERGA